MTPGSELKIQTYSRELFYNLMQISRIVFRAFGCAYFLFQQIFH